MLRLDDDMLETIGITKGARHKILLSIAKLKDRSTMLTELETEVMNGADLNAALKKVKSVLQSPLQIAKGEDLPAQIVRVMGKGDNHLFMLFLRFNILFCFVCSLHSVVNAQTAAGRVLGSVQLAVRTSGVTRSFQRRPEETFAYVEGTTVQRHEPTYIQPTPKHI